MLTTIHDKVKGILATVVLVLVGIPFILWGVGSYVEEGPSLSVAKVDGEPIPQRAYRAAFEQFRGRLDPKTAESPQFKQLVVDGLIEQTLLLRDAQTRGYRVGDQHLGQIIRQLPYFQRDGRFDPPLYESLLRREGIGVQEFEQRLRGESVTGQVQRGLSGSGFVTEADVQALVRLLRQEREIAHVLIRIEPLAARAVVSPAEIEQHHAAHGDRYQSPEQVRVEYVRLAVEEIAKQVVPNEAELRKAHADEGAKVAFDKRRAGLVNEVRRRKAEERFFELAERFQTLAYENPDSLASAAEAVGATMQKSDWFTRTGGDGIAASPRLVEAAFSQEVLNQRRNSDPIEIKPGELVAVRLLEHRPAAPRSLAEVRAQIESLLKQQQAEIEARKQTDELMQQLRGGVTLSAAASKRGLSVPAAKTVTREQAGGVDPRIVEAAFRLPRPDAGKSVHGSVALGSQGIAVFTLARVLEADARKVDAASAEKARRLLLQHRASDYYTMYRAGLRQQADIKVFADRL